MASGERYETSYAEWAEQAKVTTEEHREEQQQVDNQIKEVSEQVHGAEQARSDAHDALEQIFPRRLTREDVRERQRVSAKVSNLTAGGSDLTAGTAGDADKRATTGRTFVEQSALHAWRHYLNAISTDTNIFSLCSDEMGLSEAQYTYGTQQQQKSTPQQQEQQHPGAAINEQTDLSGDDRTDLIRLRAGAAKALKSRQAKRKRRSARKKAELAVYSGNRVGSHARGGGQAGGRSSGGGQEGNSTLGGQAAAGGGTG